MKIEKADDHHYMVREAMMSRLQDQGHYLPDISHFLVMDNGDLIGAIDVQYQPCLFLWMDEEVWNPLAAFRAWKQIQAMWKDKGWPKMLIAIQPESPFYHWAKETGFEVIGDMRLASLNLK